MLFSYNPKIIVLQFSSIFIKETDLISKWIVGWHNTEDSFSDEGSAGNAFSFELNNPNSSAFFNSFNFDIKVLNNKSIGKFSLISVFMSGLQIGKILSFINFFSWFQVMFLKIKFEHLNSDFSDILHLQFQSNSFIDFPLVFILRNNSDFPLFLQFLNLFWGQVWLILLQGLTKS